jgi:hypothetical protein
MCGGYQYNYSMMSTGGFGIGAVVVGTLILIAIIAIFCTMC